MSHDIYSTGEVPVDLEEDALGRPRIERARQCVG